MAHNGKLKILRACIISGLAVFILPGCKKNDVTPTDPVIRVEAAQMENLAYGTHPLQKMDVYLPANRSDATSVVIFVHGGSFIEGDKSDFTSMVKELVRADFAVVNVNYRLVDATGLYSSPVLHRESAIKVKDQVNDIAAVVDFVRGKSTEWKISTQKLGLAGHSAGATLALLYSYGEQNTGKIKAVVNLAGSLDQTIIDIPFYNYILPESVLEAAFRLTGYVAGPDTDSYYREISPLYKANAAQKIPTLTIFPEFNQVNGLPKQNRATFDAFTSTLNSVGIPNKFVQIAGADHEFSRPGNLAAVLQETIAYFKNNL